MKDTKNPFLKWRTFTEEELRESKLPGARIELAARTNTAEDFEEALKVMRSNTYNMAFLLSIVANQPEKLRAVLTGLQPVIVSLTLVNRNLSVEGNEDIFAFLGVVLQKDAGDLLELASEGLRKLAEKPTRLNSKLVSQMGRYGFSPLECMYLNYVWVRNKSSAAVRVKLFANLLELYFLLPEPLQPVQRRFIQEECAQLVGYEKLPLGKQITSLCHVQAVNESNFDFALELAEKKLLSDNISFIVVTPFSKKEVDMFCRLNNAQKMHSMDCALPGFHDIEALTFTLQECNYSNYLELERDLPTNAILEFLRLGIRDFSDFEEYTLRNLFKSEVPIGLIKKALAQGVPACVICNLRLNYYISSGDIIIPGLTPEEQTSLISQLIEWVYKTKKSSFIDFILFLFEDNRLTKFYAKEELLDILLCIKDLFPEEICLTSFLKLVEMYADEEECTLLEKKYQEEEDCRRKKLHEEDIRKRVEKFKNEIDEIDTITDLGALVNRQYSREVLDISYPDVLTKAQELLATDISFNSGYLLIFVHAFDKGCLTFQEFMQLSEKVNNLRGGSVNEDC